MGKGTDPARKLRKIRDSREGWKSRAGEKQQEIKRLRGTVRDLMVSREHWKNRIEELEQQVYALQQEALSASCTFLFLGGRCSFAFTDPQASDACPTDTADYSC